MNLDELLFFIVLVFLKVNEREIDVLLKLIEKIILSGNIK